MTEILEMNFGKGMLQDIPGDMLPDGYCNSIRNAVWFDGGLLGTAPSSLSTLHTISSVAPTGAAIFIGTDGNLYVFVGTATKLYRNGVDVSQSGVTYSSEGYDWQFCQYGDWVIATNGVNTPQVLKGISTATAFVDLGGTPPKGRYIHLQNGHLMFGYVFGTEKVTNGSFTGSATGWTVGAAWAYNSNAVDKNADGVTTLSQNVSAVAGETYRVRLTVSNWTFGGFTVSIGGTAYAYQIEANGTYYLYLQAINTNNLIFTPTNTSRFTIDDVSVETVYNKRVQWSGLENIETWASSLSTGAGSQDIADSMGDITGIGEVQSGFVVFSSGSYRYGQYSGSPWTFVFPHKSMVGAGAYRYTIVSDGTKCFYLSNEAAFVTDGFSHSNISGGNQITFWGTLKVAGTYPRGTIDTQRKVIYWTHTITDIPSTGVTSVLAYNYEYNVWTYADYQHSWTGTNNVRSYPFIYGIGANTQGGPFLGIVNFWDNANTKVQYYYGGGNATIISRTIKSHDKVMFIRRTKFIGATVTFTLTYAINGSSPSTTGSLSVNTRSLYHDMLYSANTFFYTITLPLSSFAIPSTADPYKMLIEYVPAGTS